MVIIDEKNVVIQPLAPSWFNSKVEALDVLRLDLLHPVVSGNKWYKLQLNVMYARDHNYKTLVTFGGGYSNHLIATAYTAARAGLGSVGIVRGKYDHLTPTLEACKNEGMELIFATKEEYDTQGEPAWEKELARHFDEIFIIPEGGANEWGRKGAGLICRFIPDNYTHIAVDVGSGTTITGIRNKTPEHQYILGFVPMKQGSYMKDHIAPHLAAGKNVNWHLSDNWHFGGFGKWNDELISFMNDFYRTNNIPLDIIYSSKMMFGLNDLLHQDYFKPTDRIICIHSGGLQGNTSVKGLVF